MHRIVRNFVVAAVAVAALSAPKIVHAQETGTPIFLAPYRAFQSNEFGGYVTSAADYTLEGFYSYGIGKTDIGLRLGYASLGNSASQALLGAHIRQQVITASERFPLDGALTLGIGGGIGDGADYLFIPVGLSLGRRFILEGSKISFVPYIHPFLGVSHVSGSTDLKGGLGMGVDVRFSKALDLRVSGGFGDVDGIAIGLAFVR